jgi:hypothetical protein
LLARQRKRWDKMPRFVFEAVNDRRLARESHFDFLSVTPNISQPIAHTPKANRTPNAGEATQARLPRTHSRHASSSHATEAADSDSAAAGRSSRATPTSAARLRAITRVNPFARSRVRASTIARVVSLARTCSSDGFPSGWFQRRRSRNRECAWPGVVDAFPHTSPPITGNRPAADNFELHIVKKPNEGSARGRARPDLRSRLRRRTRSPQVPRIGRLPWIAFQQELQRLAKRESNLRRAQRKRPAGCVWV